MIARMAARESMKKGLETRRKFPGHAPHNLLPPTRPYLLFSTAFQICHQSMTPSMDESINEIRASMIKSLFKISTSEHSLGTKS
jgi:hypothetical protein